MAKVEELLAKHPHLTKVEAEEIVKEKNKRKKEKRAAKADRVNAKKLKNEANRQSITNNTNDA